MSEPWMRDALCTEVGVHLFYPPDPELELTRADGSWWERGRYDGYPGGAKMICRRCEVEEECGLYALLRPELEGVWGGMTEKERIDIRAGRVA